MSHVAPHRWADLDAGRVGAAEARRLEAHASACARCAAARARITGARAAFAEVRTEDGPELRWDRIRAQTYWEVERARRTGPSPALPARRRWMPALAIAGAAAAVALGWWQLGGTTAPVPVPVLAAAPAPTAPVAEVGLLTMVVGDATVDGGPAAARFEQPLWAGAEIRTGAGQLAVQFGDGSAFAVGPRSVLRIRAFDHQAIELEVDGRVDVEVAARAPGQRFAVIAGDRVVEVRGTQFRVERKGDAVAVACRHGRVAVRDGGGELAVGAGNAAEIGPGQAVGATAVRTLGAAELDELAAAIPHRVGVWGAPGAVTAATGLLALDGGGQVRVAGWSGQGAAMLRMLPGRHVVERLVDGQWRQVGAPQVDAGQRTALAEVAPPGQGVAPVDSALRGARATRRTQLRRQLGVIRPCVRVLAKQGLGDVFVELELEVDRAGVLTAPRLVRTDLPAATAECVRAAVGTLRLPAGAAASWHEIIRP